MTMLVGWVAVDQRSIASAYIASDSRFTWQDSSTYDYGRKVFASKYSADIMAYCGEVLYTSIALSRIMSIIDNGLLYRKTEKSEIRKEKIYQYLKRHFDSYPTHILGDDVKIYHISRDTDLSFHLFEYSADAKKNWLCREIKIQDQKSNIIFTAGAGASKFESVYQQHYINGISADTSRNVFQCFCDCLLNKKPDKCGGAPQLVGIYRVADSAPELLRNGLEFGIIVAGRRYFLGAEIDNLEDYDIIRWYNELFEICDGNTMLRKKNAMPQPNPLIKMATP